MAEDQPTRYPILLHRPKFLFPRGFPELDASGTVIYQPWFGEPQYPTWERLVEFLGRSATGNTKRYPDLNTCKQARGAWAMGEYLGHHKLNECWLRGQLIGFDIDAGSVKKAAATFRQYRKIIHTTLKHTTDKPRCRVVLPLAERCEDRQIFRRVHAHVIATQIKLGNYAKGEIDAAGGDASRCWFLPMHLPGVEPQFLATDGEFFPLNAIAAALPPEPERIRVPGVVGRDGGMGAMLSVIRKVQEADLKHNALIAGCKWLRDLGVDVEVAVEILSPALNNGKPGHIKKLIHQIRDGMKGAPQGVLVDGPRKAANIGLEEFESQIDSSKGSKDA